MSYYKQEHPYWSFLGKTERYPDYFLQMWAAPLKHTILQVTLKLPWRYVQSPKTPQSLSRKRAEPLFPRSMFEQCSTILIVRSFYPVAIHSKRTPVYKFAEMFNTVWICPYNLRRNWRRIFMEKLKSMVKVDTQYNSLKRQKLISDYQPI